MKLNISYKILFGVFAIATANAQLPETDIYLTKIEKNGMGTSFTGMENITNRKGYDNQPCFTPDGKNLLFVSIQDTTQSDVFSYSLTDKNIRQITSTRESEYSPTVWENEKQKMYTVVRVDADSGQRLYNLTYVNCYPILIPNTDSVGYYCRLSDSTIAMFILGKESTLQILNTKTTNRFTVASKIGRCFRFNPTKKLMYFVVKETEKEWFIYTYNAKSGKIDRLIQTPEGSEDFTLLPEGKIWIGKEAKLLELDGDHWTTIADFSEYFKGFYRMVVNREGTLLALVVFTGEKP